MSSSNINDLFKDGAELERADKGLRAYHQALEEITDSIKGESNAAEMQYDGIRAYLDSSAQGSWTPNDEKERIYSYLDNSEDARRLISEQRKKRDAEMESLTPAQRFRKGFAKAANEGSADHRQAFWTARGMRGQDTEAPRISQILGINPTITRLNEMVGIAKPEDVEARELTGLGLEKDNWARAGQLGGTAVNDVVQDRTRNLYWLLNAAQAVANVGQEYALGQNVPELYQAEEVRRDGQQIELDPSKEDNLKWFMDQDLISLDRNKEPVLKSGVNNIYRGGKRYLSKRMYNPGAVDRLMIPTGVAVNAGVGLLNPFGGGNGYSAVFESEDDPTKTSNVVGEVAAKYIMGRTGNLLNWDEFKKVRPDVSKGEYNAYKAFKYDKEGDFDITDGDFTVPTGILKGTTEGIHGPEIQFLGRSLPLATAIMPTVAAGVGTVLGARYEPEEFKGWRKSRDLASKIKDEENSRIKKVALSSENASELRNITYDKIDRAKRKEFDKMDAAKQDRFRSINRVRNGIGAGLASYAGSLAVGLGIENERRRRNQAENERQQSQL